MKKRILIAALLCAFVILFTFSVSAQEEIAGPGETQLAGHPEGINAGDVNDDGKVNVRDVSVLMRFCASYEIDVNRQSCDVNADEKINVRDVALMMRYLAGWTTVRLGHNDEMKILTPSTCVVHGVGTLACSVCGDVAEVEMPLAAHSYDNGTVTTNPGCTEYGVMTFTCTVCGKSYTERILPVGHSYDDNFKCTVCGREDLYWLNGRYPDADGNPTEERFLVQGTDGLLFVGDEQYPLYAEAVILENNGLEVWLYLYPDGGESHIYNPGTDSIAFNAEGSVYVGDKVVDRFSFGAIMAPGDDKIVLNYNRAKLLVDSFLASRDVLLFITSPLEPDTVFGVYFYSGDITEGLRYLGAGY